MLVEALIFLACYILWLLLRKPVSNTRQLIGNLAVLAPLATSVLLIFSLLPRINPVSQRTWRFIGFALINLTIGNGIRTFYEGIQGISLPAFSVADIFNLIAIPFFFYAMVVYPFENRYAPSRFRFLLDATIASGVVAVFGWMALTQSNITIGRGIPFAQIYPIVDLILLMILLNMILANSKARRTIIFWGISLLAFFISDYAYYMLSQFGYYQAGGWGNLGWVVGGLIFCTSIVVEAGTIPEKKQVDSVQFDLGVRIQNILPVSLVLALFWFVIVNWQIKGEVSILGLLMSLVLALALIVRVGIRTGEAELYKYWQLFRFLSEPIFICDQGGKILLANPALMKVMDKKDDNLLIGKALTTIFSDQKLPDGLLDRATLQECTFEVTLQPDRIPFLLSLSPIFSEGRKVLIAGAAHDLREQKRQNEAIRKAYNELQVVYHQLEDLNDQLEQKVEQRTITLQAALSRLEAQNKMLQELDQLKSDFVSMVSHELRTPLTSLNGGLELMLNRKGGSISDREPLVLMKNEIQRLTRFVENILNLSAMEAGRWEVQPIPVDISSLMVDIQKNLSATPGAERLKFSISEDLPQVFVDPGFLRSVFNHLIDNALKYTPSGTVTIETVLKRGKIQIRVADLGPGIPLDKRPLLFKRFQRLDARDSQSVYGYGLGLYLSQRMLRAMGSDLALDKSYKKGACFYFNLQAVQ
jgi:signal transduction histidine kinase